MLSRERPKPSAGEVRAALELRRAIARCQDWDRGTARGAKITTAHVWSALVNTQGAFSDWGNKGRAAALVRRLKAAASADIIDGEWDGRTYRWSVKPDDPMLDLRRNADAWVPGG